MKVDTDVSLGDVVRAIALLKPKNQATRAAIAELLGHEDRPPRKSRRKIRRKPHTRIKRPPPENPEDPKDPTVYAEPDEKGKRTPLEPIRRESSEVIELPWHEGDNLDPVTEDHFDPELVYEPLLHPRRFRDIIFEAIATNSYTGPVDIDLVVEELSLGHAIRHVPRQPWASLFQGVRVLVDLGEGLEPFARDQEELVADIENVTGPGLTELMYFRNCPDRGAGNGPRWTWQHYTPSEGVPNVVLTDLGLGGPASDPDRATSDEWLHFARRSARLGSPVIVLTPYPVALLPRSMLQQLAVVQWDRVTTPQLVRSARRRTGNRAR